MKEFEKCWKRNGGGVCGKTACKKYWKAALEKIRHIIMFESDGPSNPKDLMQWIDKELNNE